MPVCSEIKPKIEPSYTLIILRYNDYCKGCAKPMNQGSEGMWNKLVGVKHIECYLKNKKPIEDLEEFLNSW